MGTSLHRIGAFTCKVVEKNPTDVRKRKKGRERRKQDNSTAVQGADFGGTVGTQRDVKPGFLIITQGADSKSHLDIQRAQERPGLTIRRRVVTSASLGVL